LDKQPNDQDAQRLLAALGDHILEADGTQRRIRVGEIDWEPYSISGCRGFVGSDQIARIFVDATHTSTRKDVYSLEVLGALSARRFNHIADARQAAWQAYQAARHDCSRARRGR
jgi:hypothetical protein